MRWHRLFFGGVLCGQLNGKKDFSKNVNIDLNQVTKVSSFINNNGVCFVL